MSPRPKSSSSLAALGVSLLLATHATAAPDPTSPRAWYDAAVAKVESFSDEVAAPLDGAPVGDAMLLALLYDATGDEALAKAIERHAKHPIGSPDSLDDTSPQVGVWSFAQLGLLQTAYVPQFAEMSAAAADDLLHGLKEQPYDGASTREPLMLLWARLGKADKVIALLPFARLDWAEEGAEAIRAAEAVGQNEARIAITEALVGRAAAQPLPQVRAEHFAHLVDALVDTGHVDEARQLLKQMPAFPAAVTAYKKVLRHDAQLDDTKAVEADLNAMLALLARMEKPGVGRAQACVAAAEACVGLRNDAAAVRCLDQFEAFAKDLPLTRAHGLALASAAKASLYTSQRERADDLLRRATGAIEAAKLDPVEGESRLVGDVAIAAVYGVGGNAAEFHGRVAAIEAALAAKPDFFAGEALEQVLIEVGRTTRDDALLAPILEAAKESTGLNDRLMAGMAMRFVGIGEIERAWEPVQWIIDPSERARAAIEVTARRMQIPDEAEQRAALADVVKIEDPREAAFVLLGVGRRVDGTAGQLAHPDLRPGWWE